MKIEYSLEDFASLKKSKGSARMTRQTLQKFIMFVYPDATKENINEYSLKYLHEHTDHFIQLSSFLKTLNETHAPLTVSREINCVCYWLKWNEVELTASESARLKNIMPRPVSVTEDEILTVEKIRTILNHSDVLMRAFLLVLASTGMRAGELANVKFSDIREDGCRRFHIPAERMKARKPHDYRFSEEAYEAILEWLKVREKYLEQARLKSKSCLHVYSSRFKGDDYIFPFSYSLYNQKLKNILVSAKMLRIDESSRHTTISLQSFRRWFDSTIKLHLPVNIANALIGHDEGLSANYRRYPQDVLDDAYHDVEKFIRIFAPDDYADIKSEFAKSLHTQETLTAQLAAEIMKLREDMDMTRRMVFYPKNEGKF